MRKHFHFIHCHPEQSARPTERYQSFGREGSLSRFKGFFTAFRMTMIAILLLVPLVTHAATVGFVPSTGIWFSRTELRPNESVTLYTVVMNNAYASLDAAVGFYDNDVLVSQVSVKSLSRELAKQVKTLWQPTEGNHILQARLSQVVAHDTAGNIVSIPDNDIARETGIPLVINAQSVVPLTLASSQADPNQSNSGGGSSGGTTLGATPVSVQKVDGQFEITPQGVLGEKIVASDSAVTSSSSVASSSADMFAQNRAVLSQVAGIASTITTTVSKATDLYNQTKQVAAEGTKLYQSAQTLWARVSPFLEQAKQFWLQITHNNDPKRVLIVLGVLLLLWFMLKRAFRRRRYYD